ncbi:hypothetical protein FHX82_003478 [Amycolatopsis bartoniae]|uniref:DoxX family protein n=1 Tax=Amycolatopsis bartoniae TaxID=941986 RepID=A0A8H9J104_9PSEU|nr:hypothetical protein [Amycolatopsis bartoniae]MBB2936414.1 hypothetical protein [Amycolatopsis bartoniae]GHF69102.1 hypothetical protein GCM10017566_48750 [Amycolatopsis bartoniae]
MAVDVSGKRGWNSATRVAFRFCAGYSVLFCLLVAPVPIPLLGPLAQWARRDVVAGLRSLTDPVTGWVGRTFFGVDAVVHRDSSAGDQTAIWVLVCCLLVVAVVVAAVWTAFDRRASHPRLHAWFVLFLRVCLGGQLLLYGFAKVLPTQMQVSSSYPYEIALGAVEAVAGLLLFVPRTLVLGAALSVASMAQVVLLNLTFDVPEKLLSAHLLLCPSHAGSRWPSASGSCWASLPAGGRAGSCSSTAADPSCTGSGTCVTSPSTGNRCSR